MADSSLASTQARTAGERYQVVVHADAGALAGDSGGCELDDGPALAPETARRLSCDASVVRIGQGRGQPLSVGRKTRTIPPAIRRALQRRDRGCRFPGCDNRRFVDAHHIEHWARGGETAMHNLVLLCRRHHRFVHEGRYSVERLGRDGLRFRNPWGGVVPDVPRAPPTSPEALLERNELLPIGPETCDSGEGEAMDLMLTVSALVDLAVPALA
jgi:hypothetical protein